MSNNIVKLGTVAAIVGAAALGLTACTTAAPADNATTAPSSSATVTPESTPIGGDIVAPESMAITAANKAEVKLVVGQTLNLSTAEGEEGNWTGTSTDPAVAQFVAGSNGDVKLNPGVVAGKAGTSTIKLTNTVTGDTVEFVVDVSNKA